MDEREPPDPLKDLGERIDKAYGNRPGPGTRAVSGGTGSQNGMATGLRIGLELVVGIVAGVGIGFLLDRWLGTKPWGILICFLLGFAAGLVNVYRAVTGIGMAAGYRETGAPPPVIDESDED